MCATRGIALALCLGLTAWSATARARESRAQGQVDPERTGRRAERAGPVISGADKSAARYRLDTAMRVSRDAEQAFGKRRSRVAPGPARLARADRAVAVVRGLPEPDRVLAQLESTRRFLDRARARVEECGDDRARAIFRIAREMQHRADETGRAGRYLAALQLTMGARQRVHTALRRCRLERNVSEETESALLRTDEALLLAREGVPEGAAGPARGLLLRAMDTQELARREFTAGRYPSSARLTLSARAFARRAVRLARR